MPLDQRIKRVFSKVFLSMVLVVFLVLGGYYLYGQIKAEISQIYLNQLRTTQYLLSSVDYNAERQKLVLFSRDQVIKANKDISYDVAFSIASTNVKYSEVYPSIDPLLLLSLQTIESRFNTKATSPAGAMGLNQVMPITARHLCKGMGLAYADSLLYNVEFNTRLSAMILDDALAAYKKYDVALAYYNGGAYPAFYYMSNNSSLPEETKQYIPDVMQRWKEFRELYKTYILQPDSLVKKDAVVNKNIFKK